MKPYATSPGLFFSSRRLGKTSRRVVNRSPGLVNGCGPCCHIFLCVQMKGWVRAFFPCKVVPLHSCLVSGISQIADILPSPHPFRPFTDRYPITRWHFTIRKIVPYLSFTLSPIVFNPLRMRRKTGEWLILQAFTSPEFGECLR